MFSCQPTLETLPAEIQLSIFSQLPPHNLVQLALTSKHFGNIIIPLLWADIEFHSVGFHKHSSELNVPPPIRSPYSRKSHQERGHNNGEWKARIFFNTLQTLHVEDPDRLEHVVKRIKHLCTMIDPQWLPRDRDYKIINPHPDAIRVWGLLPYMTNLESLEIHGTLPCRFEVGDLLRQLHGPTPRLRFAKLSGYIPRPVAAWVLKADTLERLELAMLDKSEVDSDDESEWGGLNGEESIIPRPLGGFLPSYQDKGLKLPNLTHLYLCQPAESDYKGSNQSHMWSTRAERACHRDWRQILQASLPTLKTIVLEQRPAADYFDGRANHEREWMEDRTTPAASRNLLNMVQKVLEADRSQGPLQYVYLYGIFIGELDEEDGLPDPAKPSGQFMHFLRGCGVECEARVGQWCFYDDHDSHAAWDACCDDSEDEDEDQDEDSVAWWDQFLKWDDVLCIV